MSYLIQMLFRKSNPNLRVLSSHEGFFFTLQLCYTVFFAEFSKIPRSFRALNLELFRSLVATYLSSRSLIILLFGYLGSFFMDPVYLKLLTIYWTVECVFLTSCPLSAKFTIVCFRTSLSSILMPIFLGTEGINSRHIFMSMR
jgi:hypothetical protein